MKFVDYQGKIALPLKTRRLFTPDFSELKWYPYIPLFVYGHMRKNGIRDHLLRGFPYMGRAHTLTPHWDLRRSKSDIFALQKEFSDVRRYTLIGEVYAVNVELIHVLDRMFKEKNRFIRVDTPVLIDSYHIKGAPRSFGFTRIDNCFLYAGNPIYWKTEDSHSIVTTRLKIGDPRWENIQFQEFEPPNNGNVLRNTIWANRHRSQHSGITDQMDGEVSVDNSSCPVDLKKNPRSNSDLKSNDELLDWLDRHDKSMTIASQLDEEERNRDLVDLMDKYNYGGVETH